nr:MAG TPA: hypothetical protein [Crassvirales sp.]
MFSYLSFRKSNLFYFIYRSYLWCFCLSIWCTFLYVL